MHPQERLSNIPAVQPFRHRSKSTVIFVTLALLIALMIAYVGVMVAVIDISKLSSDNDADRRDAAYGYLHLVLLAGAAIIGFLAGRWLNGLGIAFATLFVIVLAVGMLTVQLGSFELACRGHNDLVRHWQC